MDTIFQELPGDLKKIAEVAGIEAAVKIAVAFRGTYLYIHALDSLKRILRDEEIRREYGQGSKVRDLSLRFGLTERQIKRILGEPPLCVVPEVLSDLLRN